MDDKILEQVYRENLEEKIIKHLAEVKSISFEDAMEKYYGSKLAEKINAGKEGVQYLDYKVLVQILCETELIQ